MDIISCRHEACESLPHEIKCQHKIVKIYNVEVTSFTGLSPVMESIICRRNSRFGHIARLTVDTPAHQALHCCVSPSQSYSWSKLETSSRPSLKRVVCVWAYFWHNALCQVRFQSIWEFWFCGVLKFVIFYRNEMSPFTPLYLPCDVSYIIESMIVNCHFEKSSSVKNACSKIL